MNFSSAGKGLFMAGKAKNMPLQGPEGRGQWSGGRGPTLRGVELFETSFPHFQINNILRKAAIVIFRQQFQTFDPNNFTLSSTIFFQNAGP